MNTVLLKGGALVLALTLGGGYILCRGTSIDVFDEALPGSKSPAGGGSVYRPASGDGPVLLSGSKSTPVAPRSVEYSEGNGYPAPEGYPGQQQGANPPVLLPGSKSGLVIPNDLIRTVPPSPAEPPTPTLLPGSKSMILIPSEPPAPTPNRQPSPQAPAQQAVRP